MAQYRKIKAQYPDAILFFRLGDFYEMFFEDAIEVSRLLQLTLTARSKGEHKAPMCGVPYHAGHNYISRLTKLGKKVALCEQLSDPNLPGIVKRDVVRVITPGTTLDENVLDQKQNNYLLALKKTDEGFDIAFTDISTGEFRSVKVKTEKELRTEFERIKPVEVIVPQLLEQSEILQQLKISFPNTSFFIHAIGKASGAEKSTVSWGAGAGKNAAEKHNAETAQQASVMQGSSKIQNLGEQPKGVGSQNAAARQIDGSIQNSSMMYSGAEALLLDYLSSTQKTLLMHLQNLQSYKVEEYMPLDEATLKNLELLSTLRENKKEGSLLWVLDKTVTSMGGRLLRFFLTHPLLQKGKIEARLQAVEELTRRQLQLQQLREVLKSIMDMERLLARLSLGQGNARDLAGLKVSLQKIPQLLQILHDFTQPLLLQLQTRIDPLEELGTCIEKALVDEPPFSIHEGGMIREGFHAELDELKKISREGKNYIQNLQDQELKKTGISNLKIRYNKISGYYIEISKGQIKNVPDYFIRRQTLVNAERYVTPELKQFEEKILGAEEKMISLEHKLFLELRAQVVAQSGNIQKTAKSIAFLDVLAAFAITALENNYCRPCINTASNIQITAGRHPVIEKMSLSARFVANDIHLCQNQKRLFLITGPNMGGKSTYLRQVALMVLMAQMGSFIPAEKAEIGLVDHIFTRVGASDNLMKGQSTFMVEMQETAYILENATEKSLVILDEIGRGTSTYDGMSIAWSIMEYLHDIIGVKTLFATHYHELISLADKLPHAANYSVAVKEDEKDGVIFLYRILPGGVNRSYGIEVAKLAGLPEKVVIKAKQILHDLEEGVLEEGIHAQLKRPAENQLEIFDQSKAIFTEDESGFQRIQQSLAAQSSHPALEELEKLDVNNLTPLEALNTLEKLKKLK